MSLRTLTEAARALIEATKQVTGRKLKVGDTVRRAKSSPKLDGSARELGDMTGVIVKFYPEGGSGSGKKQGSARVRWASGSEASHDAHMLVRDDSTAEGLRALTRRARALVTEAEDPLADVKVEVAFDGQRSSSIEAFRYAGVKRVSMGTLTVTWAEKRAIVTDVRVKAEIARKGLATRMYEVAAKLAEKRGLPLSSDVSRYPGSDAFWKKQVAAGRAQAVKVGPNSFKLDPEKVRHYQLAYPPPASLR